MKKHIKTIIYCMVLVIVSVSSFAAGYLVHQPKQIHSETSVTCLYRDTFLRTNPTGYIITRLAKNSQVYLNSIEIPFAHVSYFSGTQWFNGTVTASYLGPCNATNKSLTVR